MGIRLKKLPDGSRYRLTHPIELVVVSDDDTEVTFDTPAGSAIIVDDEHGFAYGVGETLEEALADHARSLIDTFETLQAGKDRLHQKLLEKFAEMEQHLQPASIIVEA